LRNVRGRPIGVARDRVKFHTYDGLTLVSCWIKTEPESYEGGLIENEPASALVHNPRPVFASIAQSEIEE